MIVWLSVVLGALGAGWFLFGRKGKNGRLSVTVLTEATARYVRFENRAVSSGKSKMSKAQRRRRSAGIACYVGFNGSGKSATCVSDCLADLNAGTQILSTVAFLAPFKADDEDQAAEVWDALGAGAARPSDPLALPHPLWIPFQDFRQLLMFRDGIVLMDEVQGIADAREHASLPVQVANLLFQLRRQGVVLRWTTIDYNAADMRIRRATQVVTFCRGFRPKWIEGSPWPRNRWFWVRTYDGRGFNDFSSAQRSRNKDVKPKRLASEFLSGRGKLAKAFRSYDADAAVLSLGACTEGGMCLVCGGKRSSPRCSCVAEDRPAKPTRSRRAPGARQREDAPTVLSMPGSSSPIESAPSEPAKGEFVGILYTPPA